MSTKKQKQKGTNAPFQFILAQLRKDPQVAYATVRERAEKAGHTVFPIMYGRAQKLLGMVKGKAKGKPKAPRTQKRGRAAPPATLVGDVAKDVWAARKAAVERLNQLDLERAEILESLNIATEQQDGQNGFREPLMAGGLRE